MKTKTIFNLLAFAMLTAAMVLTTACSGSDNLADNKPETTEPTEPVAKKGYELPVTVNVTRGDGATRATFDGSKLNFGEGDKLFVRGYYGGSVKQFASTLEYDTESGKFSGTIYTQDDTYKTYEDLFGNSDEIIATLLPAGYESYGYLVINTNDPDAQYDDFIEERDEYTLATSKADGVAQFSYENSYNYNDGFALSPENAILNFTITGLAASTSVNVSLTKIPYNFTGTVTTDAYGNATFAAGIMHGLNLQQFSLTVAGNPITIVSSDKVVEEGKIYNITRGTGATVDLSKINANFTASNGVTLTGTLGANKQISIADGATVILNGVSINATSEWTSDDYAGITCLGDATIILSGTNIVKGFYEDYPGIQAAADKTLIINGTGSLTASSNGGGAGIGGGWGIDCGNIDIQGGTVTATGGTNAAGIGGGGYHASCGTITISGGTVTATGGSHAAGIGSGDGTTCGNITISGGTVTATGGSQAAGIGSGNQGTCNDITISGGTVEATGGHQAAGIGSGRSGSSCGAITISGGTVTATGGSQAAGIGSGANESRCGDITITSGVTHVTATKDEEAPNSIGAGEGSTCGTVRIEDPSKVTQN